MQRGGRDRGNDQAVWEAGLTCRREYEDKNGKEYTAHVSEEFDY